MLSTKVKTAIIAKMPMVIPRRESSVLSLLTTSADTAKDTPSLTNLLYTLNIAKPETLFICKGKSPPERWATAHVFPSNYGGLSTGLYFFQQPLQMPRPY
jgi:hypothetical protein